MWARHDAISASLGRKLQILDGSRVGEQPVKASVFVQASDYSHPAVRIVSDPSSIVSYPDFQDARIHIFEFGVRYDGFDAVFLLSRRTAIVGVYHNITPIELVTSEAHRELVAASLAQKHNLALCDFVICDSEFNRDDLIDFGLPPEKLRVIHLPASVPVVRRVSLLRRNPPNRTELLFVGRFVQAKGLFELLDAFEALVSGGSTNAFLTLAGSATFSDRTFLKRLHQRLADSGLGERIRVVDSPSDRELSDLYSAADALVIPSHHEGYCVPVVEALTHECFVVASDVGNLPSIVGRCGAIVPVGDSRTLTRVLWQFAQDMSAWRSQTNDPVLCPNSPRSGNWDLRVREHLRHYSVRGYERRLRAVVGDAAGLVADRSRALTPSRSVA